MDILKGLGSNLGQLKQLLEVGDVVFRDGYVELAGLQRCAFW